MILINEKMIFNMWASVLLCIVNNNNDDEIETKRMLNFNVLKQTKTTTTKNAR